MSPLVSYFFLFSLLCLCVCVFFSYYCNIDSVELERVQKRAMRITCPGIEYQQVLALMSLPTVAEHHHNICTRTFESIMSDPNHKLRKLLPPLYKSNYNLRQRALSLCRVARQIDLRTVFLWPQAEL